MIKNIFLVVTVSVVCFLPGTNVCAKPNGPGHSSEGKGQPPIGKPPPFKLPDFSGILDTIITKLEEALQDESTLKMLQHYGIKKEAVQKFLDKLKEFRDLSGKGGNGPPKIGSGGNGNSDNGSQDDGTPGNGSGSNGNSDNGSQSNGPSGNGSEGNGK